MTTTPSAKNRDSSQNLTDFVDGLGNRIPAEAFENDPGPPGKPAMSDEALKQFREKTAALKAAAVNAKAKASSKPDR